MEGRKWPEREGKGSGRKRRGKRGKGREGRFQEGMLRSQGGKEGASDERNGPGRNEGG